MKGYCITFRSVTYAQQGQRILRKAGIHGALNRTPRWMEERGCGYCIQVGEDSAGEAVAQLRRGGVQFRKVYRLEQDQEAQEVAL